MLCFFYLCNTYFFKQLLNSQLMEIYLVQVLKYASHHLMSILKMFIRLLRRVMSANKPKPDGNGRLLATFTCLVEVFCHVFSIVPLGVTVSGHKLVLVLVCATRCHCFITQSDAGSSLCHQVSLFHHTI